MIARHGENMKKKFNYFLLSSINDFLIKQYDILTLISNVEYLNEMDLSDRISLHARSLVKTLFVHTFSARWLTSWVQTWIAWIWILPRHWWKSGISSQMTTTTWKSRWRAFRRTSTGVTIWSSIKTVPTG